MFSRLNIPEISVESLGKFIYFNSTQGKSWRISKIKK